MTDFLLAHGAGQGAWAWDHVWGHLTAPVSHPPRLYLPRPTGRVYPLDFPGHGSDRQGDTAEVRMDECVHAIVRAVERERLQSPIIVGHGIAGTLILQAASQLPQPPKRIVLIAGVIPPPRRAIASVMPGRAQRGFRAVKVLSKLSRQDVRLPKRVITEELCNGLSVAQIIRLVGFFGPLPTLVLQTPTPAEIEPPKCPVTYVVLTRNRILPPDLQRSMANRLPDAEIVEFDACHQAMAEKPRELADLLLRYA